MKCKFCVPRPATCAGAAAKRCRDEPPAQRLGRCSYQDPGTLDQEEGNVALNHQEVATSTGFVASLGLPGRPRTAKAKGCKSRCRSPLTDGASDCSGAWSTR